MMKLYLLYQAILLALIQEQKNKKLSTIHILSNILTFHCRFWGTSEKCKDFSVYKIIILAPINE